MSNPTPNSIIIITPPPHQQVVVNYPSTMTFEEVLQLLQSLASTTGV